MFRRLFLTCIFIANSVICTLDYNTTLPDDDEDVRSHLTILGWKCEDLQKYQKQLQDELDKEDPDEDQLYSLRYDVNETLECIKSVEDRIIDRRKEIEEEKKLGITHKDPEPPEEEEQFEMQPLEAFPG